MLLPLLYHFKLKLQAAILRTNLTNTETTHSNTETTHTYTETTHTKTEDHPYQY